MAKKPISATIDEELVDWIKQELEDKHTYRNKSHLIEIALELLKKEVKKR
jgi:Arc/MetJ-type ribon-helix-helix transcriptional regulator